MKELILPAFAISFVAGNHSNNSNNTTTENNSTMMHADTAAADGTATADSSVKATSKALVYTCKMHPEVQSDKSGKCPKCGMTLVVKK